MASVAAGVAERGAAEVASAAHRQGPLRKVSVPWFAAIRRRCARGSVLVGQARLPEMPLPRRSAGQFRWRRAAGNGGRQSVRPPTRCAVNPCRVHLHASVHQNFGPADRHHPSYVHWYHGAGTVLDPAVVLRPSYVGLCRLCDGRSFATTLALGLLVVLQPVLHGSHRRGANGDRLFTADCPRRPDRHVDPTDPATAEEEATQLLDASRSRVCEGGLRGRHGAGQSGDCSQAERSSVHEVRALILFAHGQYKPAAAAIYSVLSVGPGWDWPTLSGFYADPSEYRVSFGLWSCIAARTRSCPKYIFCWRTTTCRGTDRGGRGRIPGQRFGLIPRRVVHPIADRLDEGAQAAEATASQPAVPETPVSVASVLGTWEAELPRRSIFQVSTVGRRHVPLGSTRKTVEHPSTFEARTPSPTIC